MAEIILSNQADFDGALGDANTPISFSSSVVTTTIIKDLAITKSADKDYWADGPLTYTIMVENSSGSALSSSTITDALDITKVTFNNEYGVKVDDVAFYDYEIEDDGTLIVTLPEIADTKTTTIKFQVNQKA